MRPPSEEEEQRVPRWMMSFADLLSLIFGFFVLLYSMTAVENNAWKNVSYSLAKRLNPNRTLAYNPSTEKLSFPKLLQPHAIDLEYLLSVVRDKINEAPPLAELIKLSLLEDRLVISLPADKVFVPGEVNPTQEGARLLSLIGNALLTIGNRVEVYGNTVLGHIKTSAFPSHWELSTSRALVAAQVLRNSGYEYKIDAFGRSVYAEPDPTSGESRALSSQRLEIVIRPYDAE